MKYTAALVALAAATVSAQDISVFPECSLQCIITAVGTTSCTATDFACVCKNMDAVKTAATPCVVDKCGIDKALNEVLPATEKFCADVGTGGGDSGSSSSSSGPDAPTVTTSAAPEPTGGDDGEDDGGDEDDNETPSATGSSIGSIITPAPSGSSIPSAKPPKPTSSVHTAGAPAAAVVGGWAAVLLGAVAAL